MKLMYAARAAQDLTDERLHARLRDAGVRRLQLNLDDAEVAPALRIATSDDPIRAVVSVWADTDDATRILREHAPRLEGWEVEEHQPIEPPTTTSGTRTEALANIAVLKKPDDLSRDVWLERWLVDHTPIAIATQASFGYVQNVVTRPLTDTTRQVDAIVEELFPEAGMTDVHAFYGSGGSDEELNRRITTLMTSVSRIGFDRDIDLVPSSRYVFAL